MNTKLIYYFYDFAGIYNGSFAWLKDSKLQPMGENGCSFVHSNIWVALRWVSGNMHAQGASHNLQLGSWVKQAWGPCVPCPSRPWVANTPEITTLPSLISNANTKPIIKTSKITVTQHYPLQCKACNPSPQRCHHMSCFVWR